MHDHLIEGVRIFNLIGICISIGFIGASLLAYKQRFPAFVYALFASYALFGCWAALETQNAFHHDAPASWRTIVITAAAATGVVASILTYMYSRHNRGIKVHD